MDRWVEISFDCLPLRSVGRLDIPIDASPKYRKRCENIKQAIEKHGSHNTFYLHNSKCIFHVLNCANEGEIEFYFEGIALTDADDCKCVNCDLQVELARETCSWLMEPIVAWFGETVSRAVRAEFDRYIQAGDLQKAKDRIEKLRQASDEQEGYVGMYL